MATADLVSGDHVLMTKSKSRPKTTSTSFLKITMPWVTTKEIREIRMTDFFKFYKEGGKANINVLRARKEKGPKERKFRKRGRCGA